MPVLALIGIVTLFWGRRCIRYSGPDQDTVHFWLLAWYTVAGGLFIAGLCRLIAGLF
jgi:hypothetical protein